MIRAFKEWKLVLDRLGSGEQSLLLRKGGLHEGRGGFAFAEQEFFLLPSYFHQQQEQLRLPASAELGQQPEGLHSISLFARCEAAVELKDRAQLDALEVFHCWSPALVEQRWHWQGKEIPAGSLTLALVRVYKLVSPWEVPDGKSFRGCRSWFSMPEPPPKWRDSLSPVLDDSSHGKRKEAIFDACPDLGASLSKSLLASSH